jgi:hypothetical protein
MGATLHLTLEDTKGRQTKRQVGMETETLLADYLTNITAYAAALEPITDLALIKTVLAIDVTGDEFAATAGASVDIGAKFSGWLDTVPSRKASLGLPGIKDALSGDDGSVPNTGVMATYTALFETAAKFTISHGQQFASWIKGTLDR